MQEPQAVKRCPRCTLTKSLAEFGVSRSRSDGLAQYCRECYREVHREHYARRRSARRAAIGTWRQEQRVENIVVVLTYLRAHPCIDCGESDPVVLEFDHVRGIKRATVEQIVNDGWSVSSLRAEIEKCEVRCANCHRRKTAAERRYARYRLGTQDVIRERSPGYGRRALPPVRRDRAGLRGGRDGR